MKAWAVFICRTVTGKGWEKPVSWRQNIPAGQPPPSRFHCLPQTRWSLASSWVGTKGPCVPSPLALPGSVSPGTAMSCMPSLLLPCLDTLNLAWAGGPWL